jgi:hypothetical protein|tara:strand:+ start:4978 stop:5292 length:315 start_codon:yes stop_codon:yes gene_type:complete
MSDVKILRLSTGEDVIAKVGENDQGVSLNKPFVIIPQQAGPGKPIQLMMSLYNAFGKSDNVTIGKDKVVFMTEPKDEILKSYQQNTSSILTSPSLITESKLPKI